MTLKVIRLRSFTSCRPFQAQSVEHLYKILPDFNWQRARAVHRRQLGFLYSIAYELLNYFYPKHTITITSRDPEYITPAVKSKLRRKNRLMHKGRIEEASALSKRIGEDITSSP